MEEERNKEESRRRRSMRSGEVDYTSERQPSCHRLQGCASCAHVTQLTNRATRSITLLFDSIQYIRHIGALSAEPETFCWEESFCSQPEVDSDFLQAVVFLETRLDFGILGFTQTSGICIFTPQYVLCIFLLSEGM